jgi:hypothetical protein
VFLLLAWHEGSEFNRDGLSAVDCGIHKVSWQPLDAGHGREGHWNVYYLNRRAHLDHTA